MQAHTFFSRKRWRRQRTMTEEFYVHVCSGRLQLIPTLAEIRLLLLVTNSLLKAQYLGLKCMFNVYQGDVSHTGNEWSRVSISRITSQWCAFTACTVFMLLNLIIVCRLGNSMSLLMWRNRDLLLAKMRCCRLLFFCWRLYCGTGRQHMWMNTFRALMEGMLVSFWIGEELYRAVNCPQGSVVQ